MFDSTSGNRGVGVIYGRTVDVTGTDFSLQKGEATEIV
jgi:hypothetical protein